MLWGAVNYNQLKNGIFSSARLDWQTPDAIYDALHKEFNFDFDPCPPDPERHGLRIKWGKRNFINPPYGREIGKWISKAYWESKDNGALCVLLIPSRTDTEWWHKYILEADEIRFIRGRLKFKGAKWNAPFPSCIVVFRGDK